MTEKTLRDEFAMAALTGICANPATRGSMASIGEALAKVAYQVADAMMEARVPPIPDCAAPA